MPSRLNSSDTGENHHHKNLLEKVLVITTDKEIEFLVSFNGGYILSIKLLES